MLLSFESLGGPHLVDLVAQRLGEAMGRRVAYDTLHLSYDEQAPLASFARDQEFIRHWWYTTVEPNLERGRIFLAHGYLDSFLAYYWHLFDRHPGLRDEALAFARSLGFPNVAVYFKAAHPTNLRLSPEAYSGAIRYFTHHAHRVRRPEELLAEVALGDQPLSALLDEVVDAYRMGLDMLTGTGGGGHV